ncbi:MAG: histone H1-like repetitive region-containing protein [Planctomycetia bacterium]
MSHGRGVILPSQTGSPWRTLTRVKTTRLAIPKPERRRTAARSRAARRTAARRTVVKRTVVKRTVARRTVARRTVARRTVARRTVVKRTVVKRAVVKRAVVKRAVVKTMPLHVVIASSLAAAHRGRSRPEKMQETKKQAVRRLLVSRCPPMARMTARRWSGSSNTVVNRMA